MSARLPAAEALALPCYNKPHLFVDDESPRIRSVAASICQVSCAQLVWCEQQRLETVKDHRSAVGVWAGKVWTHADYRSDGKGRAA